MANKITAVLLAMMLLMGLVGCGASSNATAPQSTKSAPMAADSFSMEMGFANPTIEENEVKPSTGGGMEQSDRKIVKNAHVRMETKTFDEDLEEIFAAISAVGGYVDSHSINGPSIYRENGGEKSATINARIPSDSLDAATNALVGISNVISQSTSSNDITESYFDSEARLESLTLQEERLLEILAKADRLEDVISLEQALSNVRYEIESLTAQLRRMDKEVSDSFLYIELNEVVEYQHKERTFSDRLAASFSRSISNVRNALEGILFGIIELAPVALIWLAILAPIVAFIVKKLRLRVRTRSDEPWYVREKSKEDGQGNEPIDTLTDNQTDDQ